MTYRSETREAQSSSLSSKSGNPLRPSQAQERGWAPAGILLLGEETKWRLLLGELHVGERKKLQEGVVGQ